MSTPLDIKLEAKVKHMKSNFDLIFCLLLSSLNQILLCQIILLSVLIAFVF